MKAVIIALALAVSGCATQQDFDNGFELFRGAVQGYANAVAPPQQQQTIQIYQVAPNPNACIQDGGTIFCKRRY
jgi:hypothetical protein